LSKITKKARDYCGIIGDDKKALENLSEEDIEEFGGVFGGIRQQVMVKRLTVASENIIGRGKDNNAYIVIGNDRTDSPHTGNGGKGHTQCDAIDIVAGLGGFCPARFEKNPKYREGRSDPKKKWREVETNPNFFLDAARIYISQKTEIDKNFGIGYEFGKTKENRLDERTAELMAVGRYGMKSAIAIKADNVRLIGRESIRLVTGTDKFNSTGGQIGGRHGIEIVAMNETDKLQPMVLGNNLVNCLWKIVDLIEATMNIFNAQMHFQMKFNKAVMKHDHKTAFFAKNSLPSQGCMFGGVQQGVESMVHTELSCMSLVANIKGLIGNHLTNTGGNQKFILSPLNKNN